MIKNNRLNFIVNLFDKNTNILLDIGTDHGYLIKQAFHLEKITKAIASDVNLMPLENAKSNLEGLNVKYYLTSGFKDINEDYDTVVIAGMGANLISKIMEDSPKDKDITYYLQPNNKEHILRKYLMDNNFEIVDEHVIYDKKYYVLIKAIKGEMKLTEEELFLGPILMKRSESMDYYKFLVNWYQTIINEHNLEEEYIVNYYNLIKNHIDKQS